MRAFSNLLVATMLLFTTVTANADAAKTEQPVFADQPLNQVIGAYKLRDGRKAEIFALGTRIYIRIGLGATKELRQVGAAHFASLDSKISIQFGRDFDTDLIVLVHDKSVDRQNTIHLAVDNRTGRGGTD